VLPVWKLIAGVKGHAGNCDGGNPENKRRLHSFSPGVLTDTRAEIEAAIADDWPSIIFTGLENIDLVAPVGTVFAFPDVTCNGIHRKSESITMTHCVDLRSESLAAHEWIVGRYGAVISQPKDFSGKVAGILSL